MNAVRLGLTVRALRRRRRWRQADLGSRSLASQQSISKIERGFAGEVSLRRIERVLAALDADLDVVVRWRGGSLDRVLDERHAVLVGAVTHVLGSGDWSLLVEVSYSEFGERGAIDLLAWRVADRTLVVVEVKTELTSIEATLRKHDEKVRLAPEIARRRFGGRAPWRVLRLLVLPDLGSSRRRVDEHAAVFDAAYPVRGRAVRAWLRPAGESLTARGASAARISAAGAIMFLPFTPDRSVGRRLMTPDRVRAPAAMTGGVQSGRDPVPRSAQKAAPVPRDPPTTPGGSK